MSLSRGFLSFPLKPSVPVKIYWLPIPGLGKIRLKKVLCPFFLFEMVPALTKKTEDGDSYKKGCIQTLIT